MLECPAGLKPWRETAEGPMPLLVPEPQLEAWRKRMPGIWIEIMPGLKLTGRALMPADLKLAD